MYCRESDVLDSRSNRRLETVLKKDSWTVGDEAGAEEVPVLFLAVPTELLTLEADVEWDLGDAGDGVLGEALCWVALVLFDRIELAPVAVLFPIAVTEDMIDFTSSTRESDEAPASESD
jgi:hypothetical protein